MLNYWAVNLEVILFQGKHLPHSITKIYSTLREEVVLMYSVKMPIRDIKVLSMVLRNFSSSQQISQAKWTLDIKTPLINKGK
ncbi:hypothetical protein ACUHGC_06165 [Testudinibacter sp. P27/CKL/0425]